MTSRRSQEKSYAEAAAAPPPKESASSDVTPAVPADVIYKLLGFTAAMVVGPIGMYFVTVNSGVQLWPVSPPQSLRIWSYLVISTWRG
ncbi:vacuolar ATPase assembly integral membrane protein vma21, variant 2 [Aspergillus fumigatus]